MYTLQIVINIKVSQIEFFFNPNFHETYHYSTIFETKKLRDSNEMSSITKKKKSVLLIFSTD